MHYKTIASAAKKTRSNVITLDNILSKRFYHISKGWTELNIDNIELDDLVNVIGGYKKDTLRRNILNTRNYGIFQRLMYTNKRGWSYCAGQSYPEEMQTIRNLIYN